MHKKWLFSGLITVFLAANLLYWLPVMADPSICPIGYKCFFNDTGNLLFQTVTSTSTLQLISGGDINLDTSSSTGDIRLKTKNQVDGGFVYLNYIGANAYGLGVSPSGQLYHDGLFVAVSDGGTYNLNITGNSAMANALSLNMNPVTPGQISVDSQIFVGSTDQGYWDSNPDLASNGLSTIYYSGGKGALAGQLAFIREGDTTSGFNQYLQFRFNSSTAPAEWDYWSQICDISNNCRNFINIFLDDTASSSLVMYSDPDRLTDSGLKIGSDNLSDCGSLNTVGGVIGCGSVGGGGGVAGSGIINYLPKWSNTSTLSNSLIYDNGNNVGISTTSLTTYKLAVAGTGYFSGTVQVATPTQPGHAVNKDYLDTTLSALGGSNVATFAGISATIFTGNQGGYNQANALCAAVDPASHICTTEDILKIINQGDVNTIPTTTSGYWISNGPPGYTVNANDCSGYNSNSDNDFGTVWIKVDNSHYFGALQPCGQAVKFACCK